MLTLDEALKEEAKAKRRADKHRATVAAKATEKVLGNYQELVLENDSLKNQVKELTQMNTELEAEIAKLKVAKEKSADSMQESDRKLDLEERVKQLEKTLAERDDELFMLKDDNEELGKLVEELQAKLHAVCPEKPDQAFEKQAAEFEKAVARLASELRKLEEEPADSDARRSDASRSDARRSDARRPACPAAHPEGDIPTEEEQAREILLDAEREKELLEKLSIPTLQKYVRAGTLSPKVLRDVVERLDVKWEVRECQTGFSPSRQSQANAVAVYQQIQKLLARKEKLLREWQAA